MHYAYYIHYTIHYRNTIQTLEMQLLEQKHAFEQYKQHSNNDIQVKQTEINTLTNELLKRKNDFSLLETEKSSLYSSNMQLKDENNSLLNKINTITLEYDKEIKQLQELNTTLTTTTSNNNNNNHEKERILFEEEILLKKKEINDLQSTINSMTIQYKEQNNTSVMQINMLQTELERVNTLLLQQQQNSNTTTDITTTSSNNNELIKEIMQDIYMKACEIFNIDNTDTTTDTTTTYTGTDIVKRIRSILKKVTTERTA